MKEFTYTITDPEGIHARPAGVLVKLVWIWLISLVLHKTVIK